MPCDVQISVHITPHPVEAMLLKLSQQAFIGQGTVLRDAECPDSSLSAFVHVKGPPVRTDFDAVRCPNLVLNTLQAAVFVNPPHMAGALLPVWIAGIEYPILSYCQIVGLIHFITVREYGNGA